MSPRRHREPEVLFLTRFEPRQQSQRIVTLDAREIVCRKTDPHNAFSRFGEGHEGPVDEFATAKASKFNKVQHFQGAGGL